MARSFVAASSQYLSRSGGVATTAPLSMACWFNPTALDGGSAVCAVEVSNAGSGTNKFRLAFFQNKVIAQIIPGNLAQTAATYSTSSWQHAAAVFTSSTSRAAFYNGGSKATNTTSGAPSGIDQTLVGASQTTGALTGYFGGLLAEVGVWSAALDDTEVASLAAGVCPLLIRPSSLVAYWPLTGRYSPEIAPKGGQDLTVTGATAGDHCRIFWSSKRRVVIAPAAAAGQPAVKRMGGVKFGPGFAQHCQGVRGW